MPHRVASWSERRDSQSNLFCNLHAFSPCPSNSRRSVRHDSHSHTTNHARPHATRPFFNRSHWPHPTLQPYAHPSPAHPLRHPLPSSSHNMAPASFAAAAQNAGSTSTRDEWYVMAAGGPAENFEGFVWLAMRHAQNGKSMCAGLTKILTGRGDRMVLRKPFVDHPPPPPCRA